MSSKQGKVNVLLVGGGGREHALAWKLKQSSSLGALWTTHPSNPGLASLCRPIDHPFSMREVYRTEQFCRREKISLVVVGPEGPLAEGITDKLTSDQTAVFGPSREAAQLESNKAWAKQLMRSAAIPTAEGRVFHDHEAAKSYAMSRDDAQVVKASGLAAGKGVIVAGTRSEAVAAIERIMVRREFGDAGAEIVIEERLKGPEVSVFALCDGRNIDILETCQDHKRLGDGDTGPNTGGMGAYCPTPLVDARLMESIQREILIPTVDALRREGIEFRGVLYAGLMLTPAGPKVLEYNVRFGDPECQCLMPRLDVDLVRLCHASASGRLPEVDLNWNPVSVCCVVLAAPGYPDEPRKGIPITGVDEAGAMPGVTVFHAGTALDPSGQLVTAGGRVLNIVGTGATIEESRDRAYAACDRIHFEGKQMRRDIAHQAINGPAVSRR